jgi:hypothetical protein
MTKLPKPIPKKEFIADVAQYERRVFGNGKDTLSRFFKRCLANAWNVDPLTDDQIQTLAKSLRNKKDRSAVIFELKVPKKRKSSSITAARTSR